MKKKSKLIRYVFLVIFFVMIGWFLSRNLSEIRESFDTTVSSITGLMFVAALVLVFSQWLYTRVYLKAFSTSGLKYRFWEMLKLQLSSQAVNMIIPSAGAAGIMIFGDDAKAKGRTRATAAIGYLTFIISEFSAISILLFASIIYLFIVRSLGGRVYVPAGIFIFMTGVYYYLLFAAGNPKGLARKIIAKVVAFVEKVMEKTFRKKYKAGKVIDSLNCELAETNKVIKKNPRHLITLIFMQLVVHTTRLVALYLIFYSLGYMISPNVLLAGYSIGVVLTVVSPTPSGVGFVEGGMYLMYTSLGVPGAVASTATIIYRTLQFWIPFFIGLILLQQNRIKRIRSEVEEYESVK